jgi:hypothetical protein
MAKIILNVSDEQKALWVDSAYEERMSLSEWIRRRCDGHFPERRAVAKAPTTAPVVADSVDRSVAGRTVRPDPKSK